VCLIVTLICLANDASFIWRSMILYLLVTCIAEFSGIYVERNGHLNNWVYNIFIVFEAGFTNLMFAHLFNKYHKSRIVIIGVILFVTLFIYQLVTDGLFKYNNLTFTAMSVIYVIYCLYYYLLLIRDEHYIDLKYSSAFWWVTGTLLFYFGITACNLFGNQLRAIKIYQHLSHFIFAGINIILYGFWSYSFICRRWLTKRSEIL